MIDHISIRDFAIIDNIDVDFGPGLSIITGETGSGKSILITAISLALGSRADSSYVRNGKEKAVVELTGTLHIPASPKVASKETEQEIVISREINSSGKNLCRLNGSVVTLTELQSKCAELADIHGQYDNQSLLDPDNHLRLIDSYHGDSIHPLLSEYQERFHRFQLTKKELNDLISKESENLKKLDFYKFEINEIETASPVPEEDRELSDRLSLLQNSEKIFDSAKSAYEDLDGTNGAYTLIGRALQDLERISEYSTGIAEMLQNTNDIYYKLEDISSQLRETVESMTFDPGEIDSIIERLNTLDNLKKKYGAPDNSLTSVLDYKDKIERELEVIENFDEEKEKLTARFNSSRDELIAQGQKLTKEREKSSKEISRKITSELKELNFEDAEVSIRFTPLSEPGEDGMESAEIMISTNKGEPLKPLAKTASGGEISRIMLAIKKITAAYDNVPTLIFDEIDQGISGRTASIVGKKLKEISNMHQVICITHLPQIAAMGNQNYRIYKESDESKTYTHIDKLNADENVLEIARLLGGEEVSDVAIENAKELIRTAK